MPNGIEVPTSPETLCLPSYDHQWHYVTVDTEKHKSFDGSSLEVFESLYLTLRFCYSNSWTSIIRTRAKFSYTSRIGELNRIFVPTKDLSDVDPILDCSRQVRSQCGCFL